MKHWKKLGRGIFSVLVTLVLCTQVYATPMDDAQEDKQNAENAKSEAEKILAELEAKKADMQAYIADLDGQLNALQVQVDDLNAQKSELESQIAQKQADLETVKQQEEQQYTDMCSRIRFLYEYGDVSYAEALFAAEDMCDMLNQEEYVSSLADYDYRMLTRLIDTREQIQRDEESLQADLVKIDEVVAEVEAQQGTLNELVEAKQQEMAANEVELETQQELVDKYEAEIRAAAAEIAAIEAEAARKLEEAKKAQQAQQQANSGGNESTSTGQVSTGGGSEYHPYEGGGLIWPVPSSRRINSPFGNRTPGGVVTAEHFGVDIGCPNGTPIVAAASGVVVLAKYSDSAGNWIIISHGNGLYTVYMHASVLYVSAGQYVNGGDTIMLSGATGATQGRHLHYEIRVGGYSSGRLYSVDPLTYY